MGTIAQALQRLNTAKQQIASAIVAKGGTVAQGDGFEDFPQAIANIQGGGVLGGYDIVSTIKQDGSQKLAITDTYEKTKLVKFIERTITQLTADDFEGCTTIGDGAFSRTPNLITVVIPSAITSIGEHSFSYCGNLTTVTFGNGLVSIGNSAFSQCSSLTNVIFPTSLETIGDSAFALCRGLRNVIIPNNVVSIGQGVFLSCSGIISLSLSTQLTELPNSALHNCSELNALTIPANVTTIGSTALRIGSTTNKATFTFLRQTPPIIDVNAFDTTKLEKIIVPQGTRQTYISASNWANLAEFIEEAT